MYYNKCDASVLTTVSCVCVLQPHSLLAHICIHVLARELPKGSDSGLGADL